MSAKTAVTSTSFNEHLLDINKQLGLDSKTMVNDTFDDPFITCVFVPVQ